MEETTRGGRAKERWRIDTGLAEKTERERTGESRREREREG